MSIARHPLIMFATKPAASAYDSDAEAFFTATGITDTTQKNAVNTLVTDLKGYGIWTKMNAIYPMVGGTATTHKFNLKNPADTDAAFRLLFSGGWTHSANGALPNGTNGFANTFFSQQTNALNSNHLAMYLGNVTTYSSTIEADVSNDAGSVYFGLYTSYSAAFKHNWSSGGSNLLPNATISNNNGLWIGNRPNSTTVNFYKDATKLGENTSNSITGASTNTLRLGCRWQLTEKLFSSSQFKFVSLGSGLTDTEATNLNTAVQAFQITLSRNA